MNHVVVYVPGLGDADVRGRKLLVGWWRLYGVRPIVHRIGWSDEIPFATKRNRLLSLIDQLHAQGRTVSLVGESAGASMVIHALAARPQAIHRVACICGKLRGAESIHPSTYRRNPAFRESMQALPKTLSTLPQGARGRIRSVRPLRDRVVPPADTIIAGAESRQIISIGHAASIVLGTTIFSWSLLGFIKRG